MTGTAVIVYVRSFSPLRCSVCLDSCHQLRVSAHHISNALKLSHTCDAQLAQEVTSAHGNNPLAAVAQLDDSFRVKVVVVAVVSGVRGLTHLCDTRTRSTRFRSSYVHGAGRIRCGASVEGMVRSCRAGSVRMASLSSVT